MTLNNLTLDELELLFNSLSSYKQMIQDIDNHDNEYYGTLHTIESLQSRISKLIYA